MSASPSRWSAPVRTVIAATASRLASAGSPAPRPSTRATRTDEPDEGPDQRERGGAARGGVGRADGQPGQQRQGGPDACSPTRCVARTETARVGDLDRDGHQRRPDRQADERRVDAEDAADVAAVERARGRPVGDDPAGVS